MRDLSNRLVLAIATLVLGAFLPAFAQTQRPPDAIAVLSGAEDCDQLRRQLGREGVWVSRYAVVGGRNSFASGSYTGAGSACFRSVQQCERFLTEVALDYQLAEAGGDCRKGQ